MLKLGLSEGFARSGMYAVFGAIYCGSLVQLARGIDPLRSLVRARPVLLLGAFFPVVLGFVSAAWSEAPAVTLLRVLGLMGSCFVGLHLAISFKPRAQLQIVAGSLGSVLLTSLLIVWIWPEAGVMRGNHEGAWMGIYGHKNEFGRVVALAPPVFALLAWKDKQRRVGWAAGWAIACWAIAASQSRASLLVAISGLLMIATIAGANRLGRKSLIGIVALLGFVGLVAAPRSDALLICFVEFLGRDASLSGRVEIWNTLVAAGSARSWLGSGYGVFWNSIAPSLSLDVGAPHSGFVQLYLDLGLVGLLGFSLVLAGFWIVSLLRAIERPSLGALWFLVFLTYLPLSNLAETSLVRHNSMTWAVYAAAIVGLVRRVPDPRPGDQP